MEERMDWKCLSRESRRRERSTPGAGACRETVAVQNSGKSSKGSRGERQVQFPPHERREKPGPQRGVCGVEIAKEEERRKELHGS